MPLNLMLEGTPIGELFMAQTKKAPKRKISDEARDKLRRLRVLRKIRKERGFPTKRKDE